jgi:hypothetical protein
MACHIGHKGTGNRQIEASYAPLTAGIRCPWHWNRDNGVALFAHIIRKASVFTTKEQHISVLKFEVAQATASTTAATNNPALRE